MSVVTVAEKPPRKFPPPCWTQDEALVLIDAYRRRWYALRRSYLRGADWESVAAEIGDRCPDSSPAKTSAQCRHKMEKLRQRYRAEKQRQLSYPGRFSSSWFFFFSMDSMENGSSPSIVSSHQQTDDQNNSGKVSESLIDHNSMKLRVNLRKTEKVDEDSVPLGFVKGDHSKIDQRSSPNFVSRASNGHSSYFDARFRLKNEIDGNRLSPGLKSKKFSKIYESIDHDHDFIPPNHRSKKKSKLHRYSNHNDSQYEEIDDDDGEVWVRIPSNGDSKSRFNPRDCRGVKRGRNGMEAMVASIKLLGEGFLKMEKMKMDMAKEIEKTRMEMEMKRSELILESQQQIVDSFVKALLESRKTMKTTALKES